jgi:hypothetical protein
MTNLPLVFIGIFAFIVVLLGQWRTVLFKTECRVILDFQGFINRREGQAINICTTRAVQLFLFPSRSYGSGQYGAANKLNNVRGDAARENSGAVSAVNIPEKSGLLLTTG